MLVMNPPFKAEELRFMVDMAEFAGIPNALVVQPINYLLKKKPVNKLAQKAKKLVTPHIRKLEVYNGNPVFDIDLSYPLANVYYSREPHKGKVKVVNKATGKAYFIEDINTDLSLHWKAWVDKDLRMKDKFLETTQPGFKSLKGMKEFKNPNGKWFVKLPFRVGHKSDSDLDITKFHNPDFFCFFYKGSKIVPISANEFKMPRLSDTPWWSFETKEEAENFIQYLKGPFARLYLSFVKMDAIVRVNYFENIPAVDFKNPEAIRSKNLFKAFGFTRKQVDYALEFIPEYFDNEDRRI